MINDQISSTLLLLTGGGAGAENDPAQIDADNIVLLLDGDLDLNSSTWKNQVGDQANMEFGKGGSPETVTITTDPDIINGHPFVDFIGGDGQDYGVIATPVIRPSVDGPLTTYLVVRQDGFFGNKHIFDDTITTSVRHTYRQTSPNFNYVVNGTAIVTPSLVTGKWGIISANIVDGTGNPSSTRSYIEDGSDSGRLSGDFNAILDITGIIIGQNAIFRHGANISVAYVLWRQAGPDGDTEEVQDAIFAAIRTRFGI